jgi:hypothetical protein
VGDLVQVVELGLDDVFLRGEPKGRKFKSCLADYLVEATGLRSLASDLPQN